MSAIRIFHPDFAEPLRVRLPGDRLLDTQVATYRDELVRGLWERHRIQLPDARIGEAPPAQSAIMVYVACARLRAANRGADAIASWRILQWWDPYLPDGLGNFDRVSGLIARRYGCGRDGYREDCTVEDTDEARAEADRVLLDEGHFLLDAAGALTCSVPALSHTQGPQP